MAITRTKTENGIKVVYITQQEGVLPPDQDSKRIENQRNTLPSEHHPHILTPEMSRTLFSPSEEKTNTHTHLYEGYHCDKLPPYEGGQEVIVKDGFLAKLNNTHGLIDARDKQFLLLSPGKYSIRPGYLVDMVAVTEDSISNGPIHYFNVKENEYVYVEQLKDDYHFTHIEQKLDDRDNIHFLREKLKTLKPNTIQYWLTLDGQGIGYRVNGLDGDEKNATIFWSDLPQGVNRPQNINQIVSNKSQWFPIILEFAAKQGHIPINFWLLSPGFHCIYLNKPTYVERVSPPISGGEIKIRAGMPNEKVLFAIVPEGMAGIVNTGQSFGNVLAILYAGVHFITPGYRYYAQISINPQTQEFLLNAQIKHSESVPFVDVQIKLTVDFRIKGLFQLLNNLEISDPQDVYHWFDYNITNAVTSYIAKKTFNQLNDWADVGESIRSLLVAADANFRRQYIEINRLSVEIHPTPECQAQLVQESLEYIEHVTAKLQPVEVVRDEKTYAEERLNTMREIFGVDDAQLAIDNYDKMFPTVKKTPVTTVSSEQKQDLKAESPEQAQQLLVVAPPVSEVQRLPAPRGSSASPPGIYGNRNQPPPGRSQLLSRANERQPESKKCVVS